MQNKIWGCTAPCSLNVAFMPQVTIAPALLSFFNRRGQLAPIFFSLVFQGRSSDMLPSPCRYETLRLFWCSSCLSFQDTMLKRMTVTYPIVLYFVPRVFQWKVVILQYMVGWKLKILFLDPNSDKFQVLRSKKRTNVNPSLYNTTCLINLSAVDDLVAALLREVHMSQILIMQLNRIQFLYLSCGFSLAEIVQEFTNKVKKCIIIILEFTNGNKSMADKILKINCKTLYYKMRTYSI